jgi:hypothetical protein
LSRNAYASKSIPTLFRTPKSKRNSAAQKNAITQGWVDLLEHYNERIRELGRDLIVYAFFVGGGGATGVHNIYDLVPYRHLNELRSNLADPTSTFGEFVKGFMLSANSADPNYIPSFASRVLRSSYASDRLVPRVSTRSKDIGAVYIQAAESPQYPIGHLVVRNPNIVKNKDFDTIKPYIKTVTRGNTDLYQLSARFKNNVKISKGYGEDAYVYTLVEKLGYARKGHTLHENAERTAVESNKLPAWLFDRLQPVLDGTCNALVLKQFAAKLGVTATAIEFIPEEEVFRSVQELNAMGVLFGEANDDAIDSTPSETAAELTPDTINEQTEEFSDEARKHCKG